MVFICLCLFFPYLQNGDNIIIRLIGLLRREGVHFCKMLSVELGELFLLLTLSSSPNLTESLVLNKSLLNTHV